MLNATLGRLMAAAGVRFEAINVAMGNTRVAPYSFCVDAHAGYEADIISWDMVRFEGARKNRQQQSALCVYLFPVGLDALTCITSHKMKSERRKREQPKTTTFIRSTRVYTI